MRGDTCDCNNPKNPGAVECDECKALSNHAKLRSNRFAGVQQKIGRGVANYKDWHFLTIDVRPIAGVGDSLTQLSAWLSNPRKTMKGVLSS